MLWRRVAAPPFVQPKQHLATPGFRAIIRVFFVDDLFLLVTFLLFSVMTFLLLLLVKAQNCFVCPQLLLCAQLECIMSVPDSWVHHHFAQF